MKIIMTGEEADRICFEKSLLTMEKMLQVTVEVQFMPTG